MFYNVADESCERAEECRREAARATNAEDKAAWLSLAGDWLKLAQITDVNLAPLAEPRAEAIPVST